MRAIDNPQVLEEGFVIFDSCFDPWSMDELLDGNDFKDFNYWFDIKHRDK